MRLSMKLKNIEIRKEKAKLFLFTVDITSKNTQTHTQIHNY